MLAYRGFRVLQWVIERLPRPWAYALSIVVARLAWVLSWQARARLEFNLRVALPEADARTIRRIAWQNFRNHSKAYADLMQLPRARVADLKPLLKLRNERFLDEALSAGKGVLVVSAHMGSWEVAAAIWSATITPVGLFAEELDPPELYDWYRTTRQRLGISVLPLNRTGLKQVMQALDAGEMIVTAIDRDVAGSGIRADFFGRPASIPTGPAAIALRKGVPLLPVCVYRLPDDTYMAEGWEPIWAEPTGDREADVRALTERLVRHLELIIRQHPEQWHMPHRIWEGSP
jgi:KDO2-lipid IV(A) lauroyltransferase